MPYFEFRQNNSGGSFIAPAVVVYIQADTPAEANTIAEANGIYFDGVLDDIDCDCCGDRWYAASDWDATDEIPEPDSWTRDFARDDRVPAHLVIGDN